MQQKCESCIGLPAGEIVIYRWTIPKNQNHPSNNRVKVAKEGSSPNVSRDKLQDLLINRISFEARIWGRICPREGDSCVEGKIGLITLVTSLV